MPTIENLNYNSYPELTDYKLIIAIVDYFKSLQNSIPNNPFITALDGNIYPYRINDISAFTYPILSIYPITVNDSGQIGYRTGNVILELQFPISQDRERLTELYYVLTRQLVEIVRHLDIVEYLSEYLPPNCLRRFSYENSVDDSDLYTDKKRRSYTFKTTIKYTFSLLAYDDYLIKEGRDPINTNKQSEIIQGTNLKIIIKNGE